MGTGLESGQTTIVLKGPVHLKLITSSNLLADNESRAIRHRPTLDHPLADSKLRGGFARCTCVFYHKGLTPPSSSVVGLVGGGCYFHPARLCPSAAPIFSIKNSCLLY